MSGSLVSPGVQVQVIDESFYGTSGPGTVPFIMMATAQDKSQPGRSTSTAPGTVQANANRLYLMTSQRELLQTFGNPKFYTQGGTPQHGNELNEYGLYTAYQYLGLANRAWVMRADVDLAALSPSTVQPSGDPLNGDLWMDLSNSSWGLFRSNGNPNASLAWGAVKPVVIDTAAKLERFVESQISTPVRHPNDQLSLQSSTLTVSGVPVTIFNADLKTNSSPYNTSLNSLVYSINTNLPLAKMGITASVIQSTVYVKPDGAVVAHTATVYNLRITSSDITQQIDFGGSNASDLGILGLGADVPGYPANKIAPINSIGTLGDIAVNAVYYLGVQQINDAHTEASQLLVQGVQFFEKIAVVTDNLTTTKWFEIGSVEWAAAQPTVVTGSVSSPTLAAGSAHITIGSGNAITVTVVQGDTLSTFVNKINTALVADKALASVYTVGTKSFLRITNYDGTDISIADVSGANPFGAAGVANGTTAGVRLTYLGYTTALPQPNDPLTLASGSIWINTNPGNRGAAISLKRYNSGTMTWAAQQVPLYGPSQSSNNSATTANSAYGALKTVGSLYASYSDAGTYSAPTARVVVQIWTGTAWQGVQDYNNVNNYSQSLATPTGAPVDGTYWYNTNLQVDIMVNDGTHWMGYREVFPATDPNGPILSGTQPSYQSDNRTALANNDLWIDTSDLENYPKISRWDAFNQMWHLIDNTDQTSSAGIVFGDARQDDGAGSTLMSNMLNSHVIDSDAPSAKSYPNGILLFNTRFSTYNVKQWKANYLTTNPVGQRGRWVTASGNKANGSPYMGRHAQRAIVTQALAAAIVDSQELRSESNFFNLIATPGYPELLSEMITLNTDVKEVAMIVLDTPARLTPDGTSIQNWADNAANATDTGEQALTLGSPYAAAYYPWGLATNLDGTSILVPPSMTVLRTIAFNDQVSYPWFAPAGFNRGLVSAVGSVGYLSADGEYVPTSLNQGQRDVLYTNKINPIAYIPGRGLVVYGQKTLDPIDTARSRINVARLINYLNYQLDNLAKPFLFEPNDQVTRTAAARTFESFLSDLVNLRAVYDFAVLCDETNNTSARIDRDELWIDVAIKPVKAIEFILIPLRILNTGDPMPSST